MNRICALAFLTPTLALLVAQVQPFRRSRPAASWAPAEVEESDETVALQTLSSRQVPGGPRDTVRFIRNDEVLRALPKASKSLPAVLKGVSWLDQSGAASPSSVLLPLDDLCQTYGGKAVTYDGATRKATVSVTGASWTWFNTAHAYQLIGLLRLLDFSYVISFNEDFTFAEIVPTLTVPVVKRRMELPQWLVRFTMTALSPAEGECPPRPGATKEEFGRCASARRDSVFLGGLGPLRGVIPDMTYYIFQIGDEDHRPVQPYYDAYLAFAETTSKPDPAKFEEVFGYDMPKRGMRDDVQILA